MQIQNPAKYDDLLTFRSWVSELRGVQLTVTTEVWREDTLLVVGEVKLACVNAEHKLTRLPDFFVEACKSVMVEPEGGA